MISRAWFRNCKSLRDVQLDLERFVVLVGPNASGKSSILQGLDILSRFFSSHNITLASGYFANPPLESELRDSVSRGVNNFVEVSAEVETIRYRYRVRIDSRPPGPLNMHQEIWDGPGYGVAHDRGADTWRPWYVNQTQQPPLPRSTLLRLEASRLIQPSLTAPGLTGMAPDGSGLHLALANIALNDPNLWKHLQDDLVQIIPTIHRLRHTKATPNQPNALLFDTVGGESLLATQVSEGTLLVLGLLAALHAPDRPNLVLLDDLDRGLHPKAQRELIALLRGLLEAHPHLQIVATTHSPYMLDCMATNEVRMTVLRDDGSTVCAPLTSHPQFEKWKDEMTPGEMWSLFGEKWLVEQGVSA